MLRSEPRRTAPVSAAFNSKPNSALQKSPPRKETFQPPKQDLSRDTQASLAAQRQQAGIPDHMPVKHGTVDTVVSPTQQRVEPGRGEAGGAADSTVSVTKRAKKRVPAKTNQQVDVQSATPKRKKSSAPTTQPSVAAAASTTAPSGSMSIANEVTKIGLERPVGETMQGSTTMESDLINSWFPEGITLATSPEKMAQFKFEAGNLLETMGDIRNQEGNFLESLHLNDHLEVKSDGTIYFKEISGNYSDKTPIGTLEPGQTLENIWTAGSAAHDTSMNLRNNIFKKLRETVLHAVATVITQMDKEAVDIKTKIDSTNSEVLRLKDEIAEQERVKNSTKQESEQALQQRFENYETLMTAMYELGDLQNRRQSLSGSIDQLNALNSKVTHYNEQVRSDEEALGHEAANITAQQEKLQTAVDAFKTSYDNFRERIEELERPIKEAYDAISGSTIELAPDIYAESQKPKQTPLERHYSRLKLKAKLSPHRYLKIPVGQDATRIMGTISTGMGNARVNAPVTNIASARESYENRLHDTETAIRAAVFEAMTGEDSPMVSHEQKLTDIEERHQALKEITNSFNRDRADEIRAFDQIKGKLDILADGYTLEMGEKLRSYEGRLTDILGIDHDQMKSLGLNDQQITDFSTGPYNRNQLDTLRTKLNTEAKQLSTAIEWLKSDVAKFERQYGGDKIYTELEDLRGSLRQENRTFQNINQQINRINQHLKNISACTGNTEALRLASLEVQSLVNKTNVWVQAYSGIENSENASVFRRSLDQVKMTAIPDSETANPMTTIPEFRIIDPTQIELPDRVEAKSPEFPSIEVQELHYPDKKDPLKASYKTNVEFELLKDLTAGLDTSTGRMEVVGIRNFDDLASVRPSSQRASLRQMASQQSIPTTQELRAMSTEQRTQALNQMSEQRRVATTLELQYTINYTDSSRLNSKLEELATLLKDQDIPLNGISLQGKELAECVNLLQNQLGIGAVKRDSEPIPGTTDTVTFFTLLSDPENISKYELNIQNAINRVKQERTSQARLKNYTESLQKAVSEAYEFACSSADQDLPPLSEETKTLVTEFLDSAPPSNSPVLKRLRTFMAAQSSSVSSNTSDDSDAASQSSAATEVHRSGLRGLKGLRDQQQQQDDHDDDASTQVARPGSPTSVPTPGGSFASTVAANLDMDQESARSRQGVPQKGSDRTSPSASDRLRARRGLPSNSGLSGSPSSGPMQRTITAEGNEDPPIQ